MTFATLRHRIGWSAQHLADRLEMSERQVRRWDDDNPPPPARVLDWLRRVAAAIDALPPPKKPEA